MPQVKTECPISRAEFREHAKALTLEFNGAKIKLPVKEFSTGTLGWHLSQKVDAEIAGQDCKLQLNLQVFLVGSKDIE